MTAEPDYWDDTTEDMETDDTLERDRDRASVRPAESGPRYWPTWFIVGGTAFFAVVYAVGGWLMSAVAWVLAVILFLLLCLAFFAFIRWLFRVPGT